MKRILLLLPLLIVLGGCRKEPVAETKPVEESPQEPKEELASKAKEEPKKTVDINPIIEGYIKSAEQANAIGPKALKEEIEAMRVKDVAWRKINWKTCLLDGIRASRKQNKPMILWIFIDLPVDDKRC